MIYVCGPMSGYPGYNYHAFAKAAARLREDGYEVVSPPELNEPGESLDLPPAHYLRRDLRALLDCDAIALLPDWRSSVGASCEVAVALALGLTFMNTFGDEIDPPANVTCRAYRPVAR